MTRHLLLFAVVIVPTVLFIVRHVGSRLSDALALSPPRRRALLIALGVMGSLPFVTRLVDLGPVGPFVALFGFTVAFACLLTFGFLLPLELVRAVTNRVVAWRAKRALGVAPTAAPVEAAVADAAPVEAAVAATTTEAEPPKLTRREALFRGGVLAASGAGVSASSYGIALGRHDYVIEEQPIPLARLPRTLDGYTIAQLSDVHIGAFVGDWELRAAEELVRRVRPDAIVLTGDLVDHDSSFIPRLGEFARRLAELGVRDGVVAIPGNHDYYAGVDRVLDTLRSAGVRVLRNEGFVVRDGERASAATPRGGFNLLGIDDVWALRYGFDGGADLDRTLAHAQPDLARVLLCHNPETYEANAPHVDLQLSGHTHGGQVSMLVRPADWVLRHGFVEGHFHRGASQLYVNRGFGTAGPPARIGTPPEVTRVVLTSA